jgi:hypothetical protein
MDADQVKEVYDAVKPVDEPEAEPEVAPEPVAELVKFEDEEPAQVDTAPKPGKLPEDFPGHQALADAGINTFARARKQRDSKDGLTGVPGIGDATATKIEEAL